mgnify:CR=1 FL=1
MLPVFSGQVRGLPRSSVCVSQSSSSAEAAVISAASASANPRCAGWRRPARLTDADMIGGDAGEPDRQQTDEAERSIAASGYVRRMSFIGHVLPHQNLTIAKSAAATGAGIAVRAVSVVHAVDWTIAAGAAACRSGGRTLWRKKRRHGASGDGIRGTSDEASIFAQRISAGRSRPRRPRLLDKQS